MDRKKDTVYKDGKLIVKSTEEEELDLQEIGISIKDLESILENVNSPHLSDTHMYVLRGVIKVEAIKLAFHLPDSYDGREYVHTLDSPVRFT